MDVTHINTFMVNYMVRVLIMAMGLKETNFAEGEAGGEGVRLFSYRVLSDPNDCRISHMMTVSKRSRSECAVTSLSRDSSVFQFNTTTRECHIYSTQPGGEGLQDDSTIYATIDYQEKTIADWLLFVRRRDGSVDFNRPWADYRDGFGNPDGEFWLGLETLHTLTANQPYKLRAEMIDWNCTEYFAEFSAFQVGPESSYYNLSVSGYDPTSTSTASDAMTFHDGRKFTTLDADNDIKDNGNCAVKKTGGWWFKKCAVSNPTGSYYPQAVDEYKGMHWVGVSGLSKYYSFKEMRLMIKP